MRHRFAITALLVTLPLTSGYAAQWKDCRQVKRESLRLQQALRKGVVLRSYRDRAQMRSTLRDNNNWLWKQCRQYSNELRELSVR